MSGIHFLLAVGGFGGVHQVGVCITWWSTLALACIYAAYSTILCYYLRSGGEICNKDHTRKCGWSLSTDVEGTWRVGQKILFLMNGSWKLTRWPRTPICWPTPYNWRVGYNSTRGCKWSIILLPYCTIHSIPHAPALLPHSSFQILDCTMQVFGSNFRFSHPPARLAIVGLVSRPDQLIRKFFNQTTTEPVN